ncbi:thermonuclease family protein [Synechococcus sp. BIOS-E4-1]|uniref:thermonuclease family protein n=1 Tax=Synechococcus sp. BIOS-E4-1 TaxID=1400864 RepID=UPI002104F652|nr:thermonuclease family protein [Synechococcus sp. BIOS-E4-1]
MPAKAARSQLRRLVVGRQASLRQITRDHYGRTVGELFLNGSNVQQQMVASGHTSIYWIYPTNPPGHDDPHHNHRCSTRHHRTGSTSSSR